MQEILLKVLKRLCGEPVYKAVCVDKDGNQLVRPVYKLPEKAVVRK